MMIVYHFKKYIIVSYTNICLKEGIMLRIVLKINIILTLVLLNYLGYFSGKSKLV
ncbi:MAG: hypothetical protein Tsb0033_23300 [Winogradskyella sp.]